jgi:hypothetical protein
MTELLTPRPSPSAYVPFRLREARTDDAHWIGGDAAAGVEPPVAEALTRHLLTLRLSEDAAVSVFTTFNYDAGQGPWAFCKGFNTLFDESAFIIQCVTHAPAPRATERTPWRAEFTVVGLEFGTLTDEAAEEVYEDHKVWGVPYVEHEEGRISEAMARAMSVEGFVHVLQLTFPGYEDANVKGDWPFGGVTFHLLARRVGEGIQYRYCWA